MALVACRECSHQVSTEAATCPQCGIAAPATGDAATSGERHELLTILFAVIAAGVVISILAAVWK